VRHGSLSVVAQLRLAFCGQSSRKRVASGRAWVPLLEVRRAHPADVAVSLTAGAHEEQDGVR
jgi:hypothetical protein